MLRSVLLKRVVTGSAAALALAAAPCLATAASAVTPAEAAQTVTLDFSQDQPTGVTANGSFGEHGAVLDATGRTIGGAVLSCSDTSGMSGDIVYCTGMVSITGSGAIGFQVGGLVVNGQAPASVDGIVTGGTGEFDGLTGAVHITTVRDGVYTAQFVPAADAD
ncbi:hypothetical protein [Streptomyces sp. NRRL F-5123]|uniref:hypothetical protein n=1 Tax=Streptomyces sp. NRRL F-5123 TaxID=1463856 RepID=UPI0004E23C2B|nr:hypothetical protein [Streptomyces sp. NRRL F-5123]